MQEQQVTFESVVTQHLSFRAGHVVTNPHVHDFEVEVEAMGAVATSGNGEGMGVDILMLRRILVEEIAVVLGHRMSAWVVEPEESLTKPCDWPKGVAGPDLPVLPWAVRPTVENMGRWAAHRVLIAMREQCPGALLTRLEVVETERTRTILRGDHLAALGRLEVVPGPILAAD